VRAVPRLTLPGIAAGAAVVLSCGLAASAGLALNPAHAGLHCPECHTTSPPSARGIRCVSPGCHPNLRRAFRSTQHDLKYLKGHRPACQDCHCGHPVVRDGKALDRACTTRAVHFCQPCHQREKDLPGNLLLHSLPPGMSPEATGAGAPRKRGCLKVVLRCFSCHGVHDIFPLGDPSSPVNRKRVAATCGTCHARAAKTYGISIHGVAVGKGIKVAPTCVSCHGGHGVTVVSPVHSPTGRTRTVFRCPDCHEDPAVIHAADLPLEVVDSWEGTVHGIAYSHGIHDVATCVSCHGAHEVLPPSDPRSAVNSAHVREVCLRCHGRVSESMIRKIHHHSGPPTPRAMLRRLRTYFPVAGTSMNPMVATAVGGIVGFLSGLFGVGGGFLMTPLLIFIGIPAAVAAATDSAQITAGATSGVVSHARLGNVDFKMGLAMAAGGWPGGFLGVHVVYLLRTMGNFDFYLKFVYVVLLGFTGGTMFFEGIRALRRRSGRAEPGPGRLASFFDRAPFQMEFPKSGLRASLLEPAAVGFLVGILAAFLGVGGGFMLIPAMVYIIGIPTRIAVGTGLFQEILICAFVTLRQATSNHTVDLLLAVALFLGSTVGAQIGVLANRRLRGEQIRVLLALVILAVMVALLYQLVAPPALLVQFARSGGLER